jgi:hypothetical protein
MPQEDGESRSRTTLNSDDFRVLEHRYKKWRTTITGESNDSDTLGNGHPQYLVADKKPSCRLREAAGSDYPVDACDIT